MSSKNVLLICASVHHRNTMKIAEVMGEVLDADIVEPKDYNTIDLSRYDFVGFGSGIYNGEHHKSILDLADRIDKQDNKKAFIFSTSTVPLEVMHKTLKGKLIEKGFDIMGHYYCKGFMDYGFTKHIFGGLNKGRPNDKDLKKAQEFALSIKGL